MESPDDQEIIAGRVYRNAYKGESRATTTRATRSTGHKAQRDDPYTTEIAGPRSTCSGPSRAEAVGRPLDSDDHCVPMDRTAVDECYERVDSDKGGR